MFLVLESISLDLQLPCTNFFLFSKFAYTKTGLDFRNSLSSISVVTPLKLSEKLSTINQFI